MTAVRRGAASQKPQQTRKGQMQQHKGGHYVGIDRRILQDRSVDNSRTGIFEKVPRVGLVEIAAAAANNPYQGEIGDQQ